MWWWLLVVTLRAAVPGHPPGECAAELVTLDRVRATAFATANPALLAQVYVDGSPLREVDARTIADYRSRGGRVAGAQLLIARCRQIERTASVIRLEVDELLGPAVVRWDDGGSTLLPRDRTTRRQITLRRSADGWRISGSRQPAPTSGPASGR